jgi:hypothetical protein
MLAHRCSAASVEANARLANAVVNRQLTVCGKHLWLPGNSKGTFHKIIFRNARRRFLAIGFFETIGVAGKILTPQRASGS